MEIYNKSKTYFTQMKDKNISEKYIEAIENNVKDCYKKYINYKKNQFCRTQPTSLK